MATLEQIKTAKMMARNPEGYTKDRISEIEANFIAKMEVIASEIVKSANAIKDASSVLLAGDNRPVTEISRDTAKQEMEYFKGIIDFKLQETVDILKKKTESMFESMSKEKDEFTIQMNTALEEAIGQITLSMQEKVQLLLSETKESIEEAKLELAEQNIEKEKMPSVDEIASVILAQLPPPESSDTPEEITLKVNESIIQIPVDKIDGISVLIEEAMKPIKDEIRKVARQKGGGGGGGMGNMETFQFSGDGVTTSFTLSSKVAANSRAIWVYYQGQWLQPTTHYTVSSKTLSITFTPESGTTIEGFYIRT